MRVICKTHKTCGTCLIINIEGRKKERVEQEMIGMATINNVLVDRFNFFRRHIKDIPFEEALLLQLNLRDKTYTE